MRFNGLRKRGVWKSVTERIGYVCFVPAFALYCRFGFVVAVTEINSLGIVHAVVCVVCVLYCVGVFINVINVAVFIKHGVCRRERVVSLRVVAKVLPGRVLGHILCPSINRSARGAYRAVKHAGDIFKPAFAGIAYPKHRVNGIAGLKIIHLHRTSRV